MSEEEKEVFRLSSFDENKCYGFALHTRKDGRWPNVKYYTKNPIQYLGKHVAFVREGVSGDGSHGAEIFDNNGEEVRIEYDYDGRTSFVELPCQNGGKRKTRRNRKSKKSRKSKSRKGKSRKSNRRKTNRRKSNRRR